MRGRSTKCVPELRITPIDYARPPDIAMRRALAELRSGLLRKTRAPTLRVDGLADEELAWTVTGARALKKIAVGTGLTGLMRRRCIGRIFHVVERFRRGIVQRQMRQVVGEGQSRKCTDERCGTDTACGDAEETTAREVRCNGMAGHDRSPCWRKVAGMILFESASWRNYYRPCD